MTKHEPNRYQSYLDTYLGGERELIIDQVLLYFFVIMLFATPLFVYRGYQIGFSLVEYAMVAIAPIVTLAYLLRNKLNLHVKTIIVLLGIFSPGVAGMLSFNFSAAAELTLFFSMAIVFLLYDRKVGIIVGVIVAVFMIITTSLFSFTDWRAGLDTERLLRSASSNLPIAVIFPLVAMILYSKMIGSFNEHLTETLNKLFKTEARYKRSMDATQDGIWEWNCLTDTFTWEVQAEKMLGYAHNELNDSTTGIEDLLQMVHPDEHYLLEEFFDTDNQQDHSFEAECRLKTKDDDYLWFNLRGRTDFDPHGEPIGAIGSIRDIEFKKQIESKVKAQEESYRAFVDNSSEGIWCIKYDPPVDIAAGQLEQLLRKGIITEANQAAAAIFGIPSFEDMIGKLTPEMLFSSPKERLNHDALFAAFIDSGCTEAVSETTRVNQSGIEQYVRYSLKGESHRGLLYAIWGVTSDVTALRDTQAQLSHAQKMDAIGHLAGGIAHDFNNSLGGIMGAAELMSLKNKQEELKRYIEIILSATERARDLNSKLLTFSRKTKMTSTPIAVNPIVDDAIGLLQHSIDKRIDLKAEHVHLDSHIIGDPAEFHSALINLGINARDAMPEGGMICFKVDRITIENYTHDSLNRELKPGDYISISVIDNGVGIPEDLHDSIFEPFFTTKDVGKGTGLGLAAVYGTVRNHRGGIRLESVVEEGTTVELLIPAITVAEPVTEQTREIERLTNQDKTILIIDDEEMIRAMASSMLEELGYKTLVADSGVSALELLADKADEIDGILLDYTMPDHTGEEVFIEIKRHYPLLKVVMGSGFVGEQTMDRLQSYGLEYFLAKPYNMSQLKEIFDTALK